MLRIVSRDPESLDQIANEIHDLHYDWPGWPDSEFGLENGKFHLQLIDVEGFLNKETQTTFQLTVFEVESIQVKGKPEILPCAELFNDFVYRSADNLLIIKNCVATELWCKVRSLHVELEQLT